MSTHQKLSPQDTEMTKLKRLWRDEFSEADRDYWREQFASSRTQADLRRELNERLHIELDHDFQLTRFRSWVPQQDIRDQAAADLEELQRQGLTGALLRDQLIERMKGRAWNNDDFKLALKAVAADIKNEALQLGHKKFEHASRTKIQAGLEAILAEAKGNSVIAAAVKQIQEATV